MLLVKLLYYINIYIKNFFSGGCVVSLVCVFSYCEGPFFRQIVIVINFDIEFLCLESHSLSKVDDKGRCDRWVSTLCFEEANVFHGLYMCWRCDSGVRRFTCAYINWTESVFCTAFSSMT